MMFLSSLIKQTTATIKYPFNCLPSKAREGGVSMNVSREKFINKFSTIVNFLFFVFPLSVRLICENMRTNKSLNPFGSSVFVERICECQPSWEMPPPSDDFSFAIIRVVIFMLLIDIECPTQLMKNGPLNSIVRFGMKRKGKVHQANFLIYSFPSEWLSWWFQSHKIKRKTERTKLK